MITIAAWAVLVLAQDNDPVERQVQRLKEQLQLSDEQAGKMRDILKKSNDDLRGVLTDEQKQRYDESLRRMGGGPGGRGGRGGPGGPFGGGLPSTDQLKEQLKLTDDQVAKINELRDAARQEIREAFQNREPGTDPREVMEKIREETLKKVREQLTDEQKPKFDEILKAAGDGDGPRREERRDDRPRRPSADERVRRVMESLKMENAEEAAAVRDAVKKIVEALYALEDYDRETRGKLEELAKKADASEDEIKAKIDEVRGARKEKDKALKDAQKALAEIVSYRQELELIRHGILR